MSSAVIAAALAPAAKRERDLRAEHYPAQVRAGEISEEAAELDLQAWHAIADWLAGGRGLLGAAAMSFAEMELAAARALQLRQQAVDQAAGAPRDVAQDLADRRDNVSSILDLVRRRRASLGDLNARLRANVKAAA